MFRTSNGKKKLRVDALSYFIIIMVGISIIAVIINSQYQSTQEKQRIAEVKKQDFENTVLTRLSNESNERLINQRIIIAYDRAAIHNHQVIIENQGVITELLQHILNDTKTHTVNELVIAKNFNITGVKEVAPINLTKRLRTDWQNITIPLVE